MTIQEKALPPAELLSSMAADCGAGMEDIGAGDTAIPYLQVLQATSPQVTAPDAEQTGARPGMLYNTVSGKLYKSPVRIVPCKYELKDVEWVPRTAGGGFVAYHPKGTAERFPRDERNKTLMPNGHELVSTAYFFVMLIDGDDAEPCLLPLSSTQLKKARNWNSSILNLRILINGTKCRPSMFAYTWELRTAQEKNDKGSWYGVNFALPELITDASLYRACKDFYETVKSGDVKVAPPVTDEPISDDDMPF